MFCSVDNVDSGQQCIVDMSTTVFCWNVHNSVLLTCPHRCIVDMFLCQMWNTLQGALIYPWREIMVCVNVLVNFILLLQFCVLMSRVTFILSYFLLLYFCCFFCHLFLILLFLYIIKRPIHSLTESAFSSKSSRHLHFLTVRADDLKFWENVHLPSCVTCYVSHVTCHMSRVTCHMSHVMCHNLLNKTIKKNLPTKLLS